MYINESTSVRLKYTMTFRLYNVKLYVTIDVYGRSVFLNVIFSVESAQTKFYLRKFEDKFSTFYRNKIKLKVYKDQILEKLKVLFKSKCWRKSKKKKT